MNIQNTQLQFANRVLELTNQFRAENGLPPLQLNQELNAAAYMHSRDMAQQDFVDHQGLDGSQFFERTAAVGYASQGSSAENIAAGQTTPEAVVQAWIDSPGHRANLLNPTATQLGVGHFFLADDTGTTNYNHYWTQLLGGDDINPTSLIPQDVLVEISGGGALLAQPDPISIVGTAGHDVLTGSAADETLVGLAGNDVLNGGGGNDLLNGYGGTVGETDTLTGGLGADVFLIDLANGAYLGAGHGVVTDFQSGVDKLRLVGAQGAIRFSLSNNGGLLESRVFQGDDLLAVVSGTHLAVTDFIMQ